MAPGPVAGGGLAAVAVPAAAAGPALRGARLVLRLDVRMQGAVDHVVKPGQVAHGQVDDADLLALQHAGEAELVARARGTAGVPRLVHHLAPAVLRGVDARLKAWPEQPGGESADLEEPCLESLGDRECPPGLPPAAAESPAALGMKFSPLLENPLRGLESLT